MIVSLFLQPTLGTEQIYLNKNHYLCGVQV